VRSGARLTVVFGVFLALFGMLGIRLWFVQIAEGAEAAEATENQAWVYVSTPAPRGDIRDRNGDLLVSSKYVPAVEVDRHLVERDQKDQLVQRLSALLAIPPEEIERMYDEAGVNGRFTVAYVDTTIAYQISEQIRDLPGVRILKVPQRVNLTGDLMAHVVGHLGLPTEDDLDARPDLDPNTRIGKLGVEQVYDEYLQGTPGEVAYRVQQADVTEQRPEVAAVAGDTVFVTIDSKLQEVVYRALVQGIQLSNEWKDDRRAQGQDVFSETVRGASVVLNAQTGEVVSMVSYPAFDPALFVEGLDPATYAFLNEQQAFLNLAVSGLYPPASTFKAVTYMTYLEDGVRLPSDVEGVDPNSGVVHCDGQLELPRLNDGSKQVFNDWYGNRDLGWLSLSQAFEQSCNIFFYSVALGIHQAWDKTLQETVLQDMARSLGFGSPTGIDLSGDAAGIVPDREFFRLWQEIQLEDPERPKLLDPSREELSDPWFGGDLMNAAIGQGSVSASPLQVAVAYAALVNGGKVWRPYVVEQIRNQADELVFGNTPELKNELALDPEHVAQLKRDLNRVVTRGTAARAFEGFGDSIVDVGGKTGTGQSIRTKDNHAWFAGVVGLENPRYVVVVLIDEGGSGGAVAAPVARYIMQYLAGEDPDPITAGAAAQ
jgi:penicillin-binding protein 2